MRQRLYVSELCLCLAVDVEIGLLGEEDVLDESCAVCVVTVATATGHPSAGSHACQHISAMVSVMILQCGL